LRAKIAILSGDLEGASLNAQFAIGKSETIFKQFFFYSVVEKLTNLDQTRDKPDLAYLTFDFLLDPLFIQKHVS